jgi:hypothetical protein
MAVHLKKILGDLLYLEEPDQAKDHLPSPEDLRNKVMRLTELGIRDWIRIPMFLGVLNPDPLVRGTDPDPSLFS